MSRNQQDPIHSIVKELQEQSEQIAFELDFFAGILERDPSNIRVLVAQAENYSLLGSFRESLPLDIRLTKLRPERSVFWYNLACSYSRLKMVDAAFDALNQAINCGYDDFPHLIKDADLKPLRSDARFTALIREYRTGVSLTQKKPNTRPNPAE
jgi:tetratricopeptide (TPR) repeat protein